MANDVRCTHGATLGKVNREELFYGMSRGLSRPKQRLIVRGFFQDVLDRIELEPVREALGARARSAHSPRARSRAAPATASLISSATLAASGVETTSRR